MTAPARRPWWKKRRWAVALAPLLLAAYPASAGPAAYALGRGWIADAVYRIPYSPLIEAERALCPWPPDTAWDRYCTYCYSAGRSD